MKRFYKLLIIPCIVIIVGLYVIGSNCILRMDRVDSVQDRAEEISNKDAAPAETEAEGSAESTDISENEGKVNLNTATREELMTIDGIGEIYADRIIELRERVGRFTSVEQLLEVEGISQKKLDRIRNYITVE